MANANAANRPPMALPISNIAQPTSVVNSMGMMRSRPGNGRRPKNSAYTMTAARIHSSVSRKSSTPANRTWPPDSGLTKTICHRLTGSAFGEAPALFVQSDPDDRTDDHEAGKRRKQDVVPAQREQADGGDDGNQKHQQPVTDAGCRIDGEVAPAGREPVKSGCGSDVSLPGPRARQRWNNGRYRRHHRSPCCLIAACMTIVPR